MQRKRFLPMLMLAVAASTAAPATAAFSRYELVDLNPLLTGFQVPEAWDINNAGQIAGEGTSNTGTTPWLLNPGSPVVRINGNFTGRLGAAARVINDRGVVAGESATIGTNDFLLYGWIYQGGSAANLPTPAGAVDSSVKGINNANVIVGTTNLLDCGNGNGDCRGPRRAFIHDGNGSRLLGTLPGGDFSEANGINDRGQVVGTSGTAEAARAFVYEDGVMRSLGTLDGRQSFGTAIGPGGQVAGYLAAGFDTRPFVYSDGRMVELSGLEEGYANFSPRDINGHGLVLGNLLKLGQPGDVGFVAVDGQMHELAPLINGREGWQFQNFRAINDAGQIVGTARTMRDLEFHAILLNPVAVPEPGRALTLATGLAGLLLLMRRRHRSGAAMVTRSLSPVKSAAALPR